MIAPCGLCAQDPPAIRIQLSDSDAGGTWVRLAMTYAAIVENGTALDEGAFKEAFLESTAKVWDEGMVSRGYEPVVAAER